MVGDRGSAVEPAALSHCVCSQLKSQDGYPFRDTAANGSQAGHNNNTSITAAGTAPASAYLLACEGHGFHQVAAFLSPAQLQRHSTAARTIAAALVICLRSGVAAEAELRVVTIERLGNSASRRR